MAAVGLIVSEPTNADIKESLAAEQILSKLPAEFQPTKQLLFEKRPLIIAMVKAALDSKRRDKSFNPASPATPSIKQETALKADTAKPWAVCKPGWHNPATKHTAEQCRQAKRKPPKASANAAIETPSDGESDHSISTTASALICTARAMVVKQSDGVEICFLDSCASHHMFAD
ncbi:hypothetical protein VP01_773g18 [Puccinia sorghi]|uniref:Uncharacterized protein n=1 Tax=Puccinia sorghi TaxID=27349 RepID=A0A0L6UCB2_9BASI|nr:hypothetical protein VP01_773g18 [Puccinia sorghi]